MKKYIVALSIVVILALSGIAIAQMPHPKIKALHVLGEGIAISASNPSDFKVLRIGMAKISVNTAGTDNELIVGILQLDDMKYALKNIVVTNGTASADVYLNNTQVGSLSLNLVVKPGRDIWYGTITASGSSYNSYIVQAKRNIKASEAAGHVKDLCSDNPEKCKELAKGLGSACNRTDNKDCRDKIEDYCKKNPTDRRCVFAFREYCAKHTDDQRCVSELKAFCSKNASADRCKDFCQKFKRACGTSTTSIITPPTTAETEPTENTTISEG